MKKNKIIFTSLILIILLSKFYYGGELPDTGQAGDYTTIFGEDSDYQPALSQPNYTDNGDGTITDNRTGLMWEKCSRGQTYFNGTCVGTASFMNWETAISTCETLNFAGYDDWRLPNIRELFSIVYFNRYSPAINIIYFPNTNSAYYWTSTTYLNDTASAIDLYFKMGVTGYCAKISCLQNVRCVRGNN